MPQLFAVHFVYLDPVVAGTKWGHLHRFLHPGSLEAGECLILASKLHEDSCFLRIHARDWQAQGGESSRTLRLPYVLVASILEIRSHTTQIGFVRPEEIREQSAGHGS